jgi:hypothetical protein
VSYRWPRSPFRQLWPPSCQPPPSRPWTLQPWPRGSLPAPWSKWGKCLPRCKFGQCMCRVRNSSVTWHVASRDPWCHLRTGQLFFRLFTAWPIRATRRLISARFVWRGMAKDINAWCRDCQTCQRGKVTKQPAAPLQKFPVPSKRFSHVHVDLVGPLPSSEDGHVYIFTIINI